MILVWANHQDGTIDRLTHDLRITDCQHRWAIDDYSVIERIGPGQQVDKGLATEQLRRIRPPQTDRQDIQPI